MTQGSSGARPPAGGSAAMNFGRGGPFGGPLMPAQKVRDFRGTLGRLLRYFEPEKYQLLAVLAAAVIGTLFNVIGPKIMGLATTRLFEGVAARMQGVQDAAIDFDYIGQVLLLLLGLYLVSAVFQYLQQYVMAGVAQRTVYIIRKQVEEKFERLPLRFYDTRTHGEVLSRVVNDMDNISATLQQNLTQLITSVVTVLGVLVMMLTINFALTVVVLLTLPLSAYCVAAIAKRSSAHFVRQQRALGQLNGHVEEMYTGHRIVKAFGHERQSIDTFAAFNGQYYDAGWRAQFVSGLMMPVMVFIGNLEFVAVAVIGGLMVTSRAVTIGDVQAFVQYARQFSQPISQLSSIANMIQLTAASAERVFELLDEAEEIPDPAVPAAIEAPRGAVEFAHVRFAYQPDAPLMDDFSISVRPGQMIAIVGPTGAGKTTLVNLLMRFYEVDAGSIMVDGVDIRSLTRGNLRRMFGMVLQDTWLFSGTIRQNIAYGREGVTDEAVVKAARAAQADHFIRTLPDSYETVLNEDATNLSQGQKQLLTIARAFLADPAILILDEATSSVDTRTEVLIQKAMHELMRGRTSFVIAHRLSTIRDADLILVMQHGRIVEQGTNAGLLAQGGVYADLYASQFAGNATAEPVR